MPSPQLMPNSQSHLLRKSSLVLASLINILYFSTYTEHHHKFSNISGEVLAANGYEDVVLRLTYLKSSEVICTIKKVNLSFSLKHPF